MSAIAVVVNPVSGGAIDEDELRAEFRRCANGHEIDWRPTTEEDPGCGQSRAAVAAGHRAVVACGGDGTVRAVLESLAGTGTPLGVVPLGTGNLLARNLGIPNGLDAVPIATGSAGRTLDVGLVNDERFAVMAGVGFDAVMIRDASSTVKRRFGSLAYVLSAIRHVPARIVGASIEIDGRPVFSGRTAMVLVGNCGVVTGGLVVFPDAEPDDGVLDVAVLTAERLRDWVRIVYRLLRNRSQPAELVHRFRGATIEVRLSAPTEYELDGEDRPAASHLRFRVEPRALEVRC